MTSLKPRAEDRAAARERIDAPRAPEGVPGRQEVVAGRYAVQARIGAGGLGVVQLATDLESGRYVALKRVDPAIVQNRPAVERLLRGARAARALSGRYVARVLDVGVDAGVPFVVTEYLEGSDLTSYLRRRGPLGVREAVKYLLQICEAVAEAHAAGLLHRDLKPENVFLSIGAGAPSVKVLDVAVSAVACGVESEGPNAASGAMRGSLLYMAPEQMRSAGGIDERADIWSIGAIGYALLCGVSPFEAPTELDICTRVLTEPPSPFPLHVEPAALRTLLLRCLDKDPEVRPPDVAKLAFALARFGGEGAEDAAERVWEVLRSDGETLRMEAPAPAAADDEWAPDTLADLPRMSPDDLMRDLETTARWDAAAGMRHSEVTLVSHAGASWDGGEQLRASRTPPPVLMVSAPARPSDPAASAPAQWPPGERTPLPRDGAAQWAGADAAQRAGADAAQRAAPAAGARAPTETERLTIVRRAPSPWPRRLAIAVAGLGLLAGIGGIWLVQARTLDAGKGAPPAARGVAKRATQAARSSTEARRPGAGATAAPAPLPEPPEPPAAGPGAGGAAGLDAAGADGDARRAAPGGGLQPRRPDAIYDEVERERRRRLERLERERRWREETERAQRERDAIRQQAQPPEGSAREAQQAGGSDGAQRPDGG
ncbi:serine/threonine-protein kinase [Sorangium sp. So ce513]|uniref:serine/threonine-protein kinase n=1 Tax=Sorangium sp. So ce513 TaxID=3133315 RepID=UPI003F60E555